MISISILVALFLISFFLRKYSDTFYRGKPAGLCEAKLADKPNWVSSLVEPSNPHFVAPLSVGAFDHIEKAIKRIEPKVYLLVTPDFIEGYRRSQFFGFTDWFCINTLGHITSSATVGYSDFGNNRRWVNRLHVEVEKKQG